MALRRIYKLLFIPVMLIILLLSSCYLFRGFNSLSYDFNERDEELLKTRIAESKELALNNSDYAKFKSDFTYVWNNYFYIATYEQIEQINFYMDRTDTNAKDKIAKFSALLKEIYKWRADVFDIMVSTNNYIDNFTFDFEVSKEDIIEIASKKLTDKQLEYSNISDEIITEFSSLSDSDQSKKFNNYLVRLIDVNNKLAKEYGYKNYLEYVNNEVYYRTYNEEEYDKYNSYVGKYVISKIPSKLDELDKMANTIKGNSKAVDAYTTITTKKLTDNKDLFYSYADTIDPYFKKLGSDLLNDRAYLFYGDGLNAQDGAFTTFLYALNTPAMYLSKNYQDIMTFVHEFGHYYHYSTNDPFEALELDFAELHSQGDEAIFYSYLLNSDKIDKSAAELLAKEYEANSLLSISMSSMVSDIEKRLYSEIDLTESKISNIIKEELDTKYSGYSSIFNGDKLLTVEDYFKKVGVRSSLYYISYSTSQFATLNLLKLGTENYQNGVNTYKEILKKSSGINDLKSYGLNDVFDENTFKNYFGNIDMIY